MRSNVIATAVGLLIVCIAGYVLVGALIEAVAR